MIDEIMEGQVSLFDRDGLYGKMSSVLSAQEEKKTENLSKEKTSEEFPIAVTKYHFGEE